jgi:hypothetical protein
LALRGVAKSFLGLGRGVCCVPKRLDTLVLVLRGEESALAEGAGAIALGRKETSKLDVSAAWRSA